MISPCLIQNKKIKRICLVTFESQIKIMQITRVVFVCSSMFVVKGPTLVVNSQVSLLWGICCLDLVAIGLWLLNYSNNSTNLKYLFRPSGFKLLFILNYLDYMQCDCFWFLEVIIFVRCKSGFAYADCFKILVSSGKHTLLSPNFARVLFSCV